MMEHNGDGATKKLQFDEEMCERYLFGELTEAEQESFEAAYFDDDAFFDRFIAVKTELLDLYSRGELEAEKRARMEPHFLATAPRRKRLAESGEFIRAVNAISDRDRASKAAITVAPEPSLFDSLARFFTLPRLAGVAVLMIAAIGGILLITRSGPDGVNEQLVQQPSAGVNRPIELPTNSTNGESQTSPPEVTVAPSNTNDAATNRPIQPRPDVAVRPKTRRPTPVPQRKIGSDPDESYVAADPRDKNDDTASISGPGVEPSITLHAGATRAIGEGNTLTIPAGAKSANLKLVFRSERYSRYTVTVTNLEGREVLRNEYDRRRIRELKDGTRRLTLRLGDTSGLGEKDYIVKLEGRHPGKAGETLEEYYFHVRRVTKSSN